MDRPVTTLEIRTLGHFSISANGKPVATKWPNETVQVLFCSLLSPLDLYFTWDRICRSMWGIPVTRTCRRRLEEIAIRPLNCFLLKEFGFNPLISGPEGIRIDRQGIYIDAHEFYSTVLDGLRLSSDADNTAACEKFSKANSLYSGNYLPGIPGKIIENTRHDLESLFKIAVSESVPHVKPSCSQREGSVKFIQLSKQAVRSDLMINNAAYAASQISQYTFERRRTHRQNI